MDVLEKLLEPYRSAIAGSPSTPSVLKADAVYGTLFPALDDLARNPSSQLRAAPSGNGSLLELFYGGNKFNPSSVDPTHQGHLHVAKQKGIVKLGRYLQSLGFDVGEHPAFGGVAPVHTTNSHHYDADALDINYAGGGRWKDEAHALNWLEKYLARRY